VSNWQTYRELIDVNAPALIAAAGLAIGASLLGVFVVLRREGLLALALPQVVAVGAAVGLRMDWNFLPPAIAAAVIALLVTAWSRARRTSHLLLPALYIGGLSVSVLLIANSAAHLHEVQHLLAGEDVFVSWQQAYLAAPTLIAAGVTAAVLWRRWLLLAQSPTAARVAGLRPARWDALFLVLLAAAVVVGTSVSGILMVLACLFLPAATVLPWAKRVPGALITSVVASLIFLAGGFIMSIEMDWPLSQSVGGVGFAALIVSHVAAAIFA
jgi:ABC-type Mn2+/Zn2+ transport system permease subunit